jgi:hypothetical protein
MPSRLFDPEHLQVFDGDIVYADDLNKVSIAVDSAVEQLDQELQVVNAESILLTADALAAKETAVTAAGMASYSANIAAYQASEAAASAATATTKANTATTKADSATASAATATTKASEAAASAAAALLSEQNAAASEAQLDDAIAHMGAAAPHTGHALTTRSLTAGNGLSGGGTLAADRTFTLGTPGSSTASSTNAVTSTSHTHAIDATIARAAISLTAGDGLSGGGTLAADRTFTLGTPGSSTATSTNAVTTTSHTHAVDSTLARSAITITAGNGLSGGGTLAANQTLTLGTPGTLTAATTNGVTTSSHTHNIDATTSHSDVTAGRLLRGEDLAAVSQAEAEAGTATTNRRWTALRVRQAAEKAIRDLLSNPGDFSMAPGGSFTSGTLKGVKVGNLITIGWNSMGHASASSPSSGTAIPAAYRPPDTRSNVYYVESGSGVSYLAEIDSSGILTIKYYGSGGGAFSRTATLRGSISYIL